MSVYANMEYNWQQMREIRLGMVARTDVSKYSNSLYTWQQMREIRLGLEDGLDVGVYSKFLYTSADMANIRKKLSMEEVMEITDGIGKQSILDDNISVFVSVDEMEACVEISDNSDITENDILKKLKQNGICCGLLLDEVARIVKEKRFKQTIVVARGKPPEKGKDGWYELYFDVTPPHLPNILEDGSADFKNVKWFELVEKDQKIAYYHSAKNGVAGYTVTGKFLNAKKGHEKNVLSGQGFRVADDGKTYYANMDGKISYDGDSRLDISRLCVLDEVNLATGNITFDGTIYVKGNVGRGVVVSATDNVYVDGYVEAARIKSGGEIFLRKGVNGNGVGVLEAKGNIVGHFFEEVQVISGGDIIGQYCMNCALYADNMISLVSRKGLLLGGVARAARGIHAHTVGNKMGIHTMLNVGVDQSVINQQKKCEREIASVYKELSILNRSKMEFQSKYAPEVRNTMEIYIKIEDAIYTKDLQLENLAEEKRIIDEQIENMKGAKVVVEGTLYEGAGVVIDNMKWSAFTIKDVTLRCVKNKITVEAN